MNDKKPKILVIGDSCQDIFIYGDIERLCPEAPVPVFKPFSEKMNQGMAYNVFNNIKSLGGDSFEYDIITNFNWKKIQKVRYIDRRTNQMFLRVDEYDYEENFDNFPGVDIENIKNYDIVVISDYNKGFLTKEHIIGIIEESDGLVFIDTKKLLEGSWWQKAEFIKINKDEYDKSKIFIDEVEQNIENKLIVTMGEEGCLYRNKLIPNNEKIEVRDLCGAGDTFLAGLVVDYFLRKDIYKAIDFAQHCAAIAVSKKGVVTVCKEFL